METLLQGDSSDSNVYGLHFMNAAISTEHKVTAPYVSIRGTSYTSYELPEDSIDFSVENQGYITFYAGSYYYSGDDEHPPIAYNDAFFSLHEITRTGNSLSTIKEISKIYKKSSGSGYVYQYSGETSAPSEAGALVFDMDWVTNPTMVNNALYYFEIPVNAGEYALGSVSGKTGAYLIYLDIGSGKPDLASVTINEEIDSILKSSAYPNGVDFVLDPASLGSITGGKSASLVVSSSSGTKYTFAIQADSSLLTNTATGLSINSSAISVSASDNTTFSSLSDSSALTVTLKRKTTATLNPADSTVSQKIESTWTITGGKAGDTYRLSSLGSGTYSVKSGNATVSDDGLLTINGSGDIEVTQETTVSEGAVDSSTWLNQDGNTTTGVLGKFSFSILSNANARISYSYDNLTKAYTVTVTTAEAMNLTLAIDSYDSNYHLIINGVEVKSADKTISITTKAES